MFFFKTYALWTWFLWNFLYSFQICFLSELFRNSICQMFYAMCFKVKYDENYFDFIWISNTFVYFIFIELMFHLNYIFIVFAMLVAFIIVWFFINDFDDEKFMHFRNSLISIYLFLLLFMKNSNLFRQSNNNLLLNFQNDKKVVWFVDDEFFFRFNYDVVFYIVE